MRKTSGSRAALSWVIRTKLAPPQVGFRAVPRPRLIREPQRRLTLICAPPGFGKSTLMQELLARLKSAAGKTAWLSLDKADADAKAIMSYIVVSLLEAGAGLGSLAQMAETGFAGVTGERLCALVINGLLESGEPTTLFLDDYHLVEVEEVNALLRMLISKGPACLKLVIGARSVPNFGLATLRARGELTEITQDQLRFTVEEIDQLFAAESLAPDVDYLRLRTEGWAVALQLALIRQQQNPSPHALTGFSGTSDEVANYLLEEVLNGLPQDEQDFLALTSLPDRLNGALANILTARDDGWTMLERLRRRGLPIVPLDGERLWYRYHHLLSDFLRAKLTQGRASMVDGLHAAAADWFARNGCVYESIDHARRTADPQLALRLIESQGGWRFLLQHGVSVLQAFARLPESLHPGFPLTSLGQVMLKAIDTYHHQAREAFEQLRVSAGACATQSLAADFWMVDVVLQCYEDAHFEITTLRRAADGLQGEGIAPSLRLLAQNLSVIGLTTAGYTHEAVARSEELLERNRALDMPYAELYVALYRGIAKARLGDMLGAREVFQHIVTRAESCFGPSSNHRANGEIQLGWVAVALGEYERARPLVEPKLPTLEFAEGTCDLVLPALDAGLRLARHRRDRDALGSLLDQAHRMGRSRGWRRLSIMAVCWRVRELVLAGEIRDARACADRDLPRLVATADILSLEWYLSEEVGLTLARLELEDRRPDRALQLLQALTPLVAARGHQPRLLELTVLRAAALSATGEGARARETLSRAIEVARHLRLETVLLEQGQYALGFLQELGESCGSSCAVASAGAEIAIATGTACNINGTAMTPRELQILQALGDGLSNKEIARHLAISADTVKFHRRNLYRKLGANTRSSLLARARKEGY
jgi:LuxR family transcriptional regulator, maltose regulon positive regulatory protein